MEKGMIQTVKEAVMTAISKNFSEKIYGEEVPQKGSDACFGVMIKRVEQKPLLNGRREQWITMQIQYSRQTGERKKAHSTETADKLYEILALIGEEKNLFLCREMNHTMTQNGFCFEAVYYIQLLPVKEEKKMERLEYNGVKTVGYEKENIKI